MYEAPIRVTATVDRMLRPDLAELILPNGKRTLGHLSRGLKAEPPALEPGERVRVEMTPFDFETARIIGPDPGPDD